MPAKTCDPKLHAGPQVYADQMLPEPDELTLPMCWHEALLEQLQHPAIINAAKAQQVGPGLQNKGQKLECSHIKGSYARGGVLESFSGQ